MRALIVVMDSVGIGGAPDAASYGDDGADTVGHIADACAAGRADNGQRQGPLQVAYLAALGLGEACERATGRKPPGLQQRAGAGAAFGVAHEQSRGKDTPSGHWEIAGVPVPFDWGYFPKTVPAFPPDLIEQLCASAGLSGILGDCHASGTEIIAALGEVHMQTGRPICYTSADSVFQIAAHEETFGLDQLYQLCETARPLVDRFNIGRVIARPFVGRSHADFRRTANRRDYAVPPPEPTILDIATAERRHVVTIGKIADIFAHRGTGRNLKGESNDALFTRMLEGFATIEDGGLLFANFVDFDTLYGHRRDVAGYACALESFDARLPELLNVLRSDDLLIVTADHGCDPTWSGSDHTRESVPVLIANGRSAGPIGARSSFADIGATVAQHLDMEPTRHGCPFW
ncbi:phosphopentomutase [Bradyrhizobium sp. ORS 285]|uniref:phosphopentomutase n=1 Tax=Bradyrhizobium sp. ORS 285 TaxID=115808 RepID=UPI0002405BC1|nr:phosphopentomutase [Bradyrhizobium sp. ORS 285]CCD85392.1 phosphopentomutase [Bradyrhizobium sp. ORS 285]SMX60019.1 phosphopentomutase [Bradyrhizobium sp. ORS 285]